MGEDTLESYFGFDQADLEANRRGELTLGQRDRLIKIENSTHQISAVMALAAVVLTMIPLGIILFHLLTASMDQVGMGLFIWVLLAAAVSFFAIRRSLEKIYDDTVHKIEGPIQIRVEKGASTSLDYFLHIHGEVFDVDSELSELMEPGDVYAFYYLMDPHTHAAGEILSVELITLRRNN
jgi:hypothetical protein